MRKVLKWAVIVAGSLGALLVIAVLVLAANTNSRLDKTYQVQPQEFTIPADAASIEEGQRIAGFYCSSCHGANLVGKDFLVDPLMGKLDAPNLTAGLGGVASQYNDTDWVRAIRHGVDPQGKPLMIMPSGDFYYISDEQLGQIIAYIKSLDPVDGVFNDRGLTIPARAGIATGAFGDMIPAEAIDHNGIRPKAPAMGATAEYGEYLATLFGCRTCHGAELSGGLSPEPGAPYGPNLTPGGGLGGWNEEIFINTIRSRSSPWMYYETLAKMHDDELKALWKYLESLPALESSIN